ncbi:slipin family protein, partial [Streptomyces sp. NPDC006739]
EIGVDKNTTVVFPAPLMSTIGELGSFLAREANAAGATAPLSPTLVPALDLTESARVPAPNGGTETS